MTSALSWWSSILVVLFTMKFSSAVMELETDQEGKPIWMQGEYRDRNDVPIPENYDAKRKHRDVSLQEEDEASKDKTEKKKNDKKGIIRTHFLMPFGVQMPLQYSGQLFQSNKKSGKKSKVPQLYKRTRQPQARKLNFAESKGYYVPLDIDGHSSRSHVPSTWGMAWKNSNPIPETPVDSTGEMRSTLRGGFKLKEEDLDDGLMFRGLGGQGIRAQNEALIEGKFDEKMADEEEERRSARSL